MFTGFKGMGWRKSKVSAAAISLALPRLFGLTLKMVPAAVDGFRRAYEEESSNSG